MFEEKCFWTWPTVKHVAGQANLKYCTNNVWLFGQGLMRDFDIYIIDTTIKWSLPFWDMFFFLEITVKFTQRQRGCAVVKETSFTTERAILILSNVGIGAYSFFSSVI